jgi:antitoxin (DNA-binding transcriptional repressor) of toxin-antitoxin stability system
MYRRRRMNDKSDGKSSLLADQRFRGIIQNMAVIHISEAEAARDFASLLAQVRAGAEVVIESREGAVAVVRPAEIGRGPGRRLSESIASAEARGSTASLDDEFARDLEAVIASHREPLNPPEWD